MSRTTAENRAAEESFERLLDRLTLEGMPTERMTHDRLASDRVTLSCENSGPPGRRASTILAKASAAAPKAVRKASEPVELSYEKALQRHSRRQPVEEIDLALPTAPAAGLISPAPAASAPRSARSNVRHTGRSPAPVSAVPGKPIPGKLPPKDVEQATSIPGSQPRRPHAGKATRIPAARAGDSTEARAGIRKRRPASHLATPAKTTQTPSGRAVPSRTRQPARTATTAKRQRVARPLENDVVALKYSSGTGLEPIGEQRRAIISVRLNEDESDRLRQRAAESGISVSAYMRSCVLEAEHLRTQVKRALTELRANLSQPEVVHLAPSPVSSLNHSWFQILSRSAALMLAPIFSLRHRV